jgi:hypothetical protein
MSEDEPQITESTVTNRDREIHEMSNVLRAHSRALMQEAAKLRSNSRMLRARNRFIAATNLNGNAKMNRERISAICSRFSQRPPIIFSIDIPLRLFKPYSKKEGLKVIDESKVRY